MSDLPAASPVPVARISHPMKVLVVDDNEALAQTLGLAIEDFGDTVLVCTDGRQAIEAAYQFQPNVILLDLNMPGMDGLQVCRVLRDDARLSGVKIIAQTGRGEPAARQLTAQAGFDLHLVKPVDLDVLEDMLDLLRPRT